MYLRLGVHDDMSRIAPPMHGLYATDVASRQWKRR